VAKLLLISCILLAAIGPALAARDKLPMRGLRRTIIGFALCNIVYAFLVIWIYPKICWE
jgi:hypothetical protein